MNAARLPDWPERLAGYLAANRARQFAWGTNDCVSFAAGAVQAVTGQDPRPGPWADRAAAVRMLCAHGGLVAAVDATLPRLATPALARRGDVVLIQPLVPPWCEAREVRPWLAVCDGARAWAPSRTGLLAVPMVQAAQAWGVGHG